MQAPVTQAIEITRSREFKEQEFSIKTVANVLEILRSKLYAHPIDSIVRELLSNAIDANTEAKATKKISISLPNRLNTRFSIQDFGPGISPDRMKNVYLNYGESTKKGTNSEIGFFGIGAKSPFAYSEAFLIQTADGHTWREYSAYIDESRKGKVAELQRKKSSETGTTIIIEVKPEDALEFSRAARKYALFIPHLVEITAPFNATPHPKDALSFGLCPFPGRVLTSSEWCDCRFEPENIVVLNGYIPYQLSESTCRKMFPDKSVLTQYAWVFGSRLTLRFQIGQLTVSASREELNFDARNGKIIQDALVSVAKGWLQNFITLWEKRKDFYHRRWVNNAYRGIPGFFKQRIRFPCLFLEQSRKDIPYLTSIDPSLIPYNDGSSEDLDMNVTEAQEFSCKSTDHERRILRGCREELWSISRPAKEEEGTSCNFSGVLPTTPVLSKMSAYKRFNPKDLTDKPPIFLVLEETKICQRVNRIFDLHPNLNRIHLLYIKDLYTLRHLDHAALEYYGIIPLRNFTPLPVKHEKKPRAPRVKKTPEKQLAGWAKIWGLKTAEEYIPIDQTIREDWNNPTLYLLTEGGRFTFKHRFLEGLNEEKPDLRESNKQPNYWNKLIKALPTRVYIVPTHRAKLIPSHWVPAEPAILQAMDQIKFSSEQKILLASAIVRELAQSVFNTLSNDRILLELLRERIMRHLFDVTTKEYPTPLLKHLICEDQNILHNEEPYFPFSEISYWHPYTFFGPYRRMKLRILKIYRRILNRLQKRHPEIFFINTGRYYKKQTKKRSLLQAYITRVRKFLKIPALEKKMTSILTFKLSDTATAA